MVRPMNRPRPPIRHVNLVAGALAGFGLLASPVRAAPPEGCTKGPAGALRAGDADAAEDALRKALADGACAPVAPELRLRLAQVLADNHGGKPGPACEAMGLFRRIAAESEDALVQSDAAARADRLGPICAGETPADDGKTSPAAKDGEARPDPAPIADAPPPPQAREPGTVEWGLVAGAGGMMLVGAALVGVSQVKLSDRDTAYRDYLAAPFGSSAEQEAADRFESEQTTAKVLVGTGIAAIGIGAALGITAVAMWPDSPDDASGEAPSARLLLGPTGVGVMGRW